MFLNYVKNSVWKFLLCSVMTFCLCWMALEGFNVPEAQKNLAQTVIMTLVWMALLVLAGYSRRTILAGVIGFAGIAAATLIVILIRGDLKLAFTDTEENFYTYYVICFLLAVLVYLLASAKKGIYVLFLFGTMVCTVIHYLYHIDRYYCLFGFLMACMAWWIVRNYYLSILDSKTKKVSFGGTFAVALICTVLVAVIGSGIYVAILRPMDLPVQELKLFEKEVSRNLIDRTGLADTEKIRQKVHGDNPGDEDTGKSAAQNEPQGANNNELEDGDLDHKETALDNSLTDETPTPLNPVRYQFFHWGGLIALAVLIALIIIGKAMSHKVYLKALEKKPREEQISILYHLFLRKFRQMKLKKNLDETPYEYVERKKGELDAFRAGETDIACLTEIFVKVVYGNEKATEEDCRTFTDYYRKLFGRIRNYLGPVRFVLYFFVL